MNVLPFIVIFQYFVFVNKKSFNCLQSYLEIPEHSRVTLLKKINLKNTFDESNLIYKNYIFEITIFFKLISTKTIEKSNSSLNCTNNFANNSSIFSFNIDFEKVIVNKPIVLNYPVIKYKPKKLVVYKDFLIEIKKNLANLKELNFRLNKTIENNSQNYSFENKIIKENIENFFNLSLVIKELTPEFSNYSLNKTLAFSFNMEEDSLTGENKLKDFCQINEFEKFFLDNNELLSSTFDNKLNINNKILIFVIIILFLIILYYLYLYSKTKKRLKNSICDLQKENFNLTYSLKKLKQYYEKSFNQEKLNLNNTLNQTLRENYNLKNNELIDLKKEFSFIKKELEKKKNEIEFTNDKNKNLRFDLKELEEEVEILKKKLTVNIKRINNLINENNKSKEFILEKENLIESLKNKNEKLINEIKFLKDEISSKDDFLKKSIDSKTLNKLESDKNNLTVELEKKNQILHSTFQELENLKTKLKCVEEENSIFRKDYESKNKFSHRYLKEKEEEYELKEKKLILEIEILKNNLKEIEDKYLEKLKENDNLLLKLNIIQDKNEELISQLSSSFINNDFKLPPPELPKIFEENLNVLNNSSSSSNIYSFSNYNYPDTRSLANSSYSDHNRSLNEAYCFNKNKSSSNHSTNSQNKKNNTFN